MAPEKSGPRSEYLLHVSGHSDGGAQRKSSGQSVRFILWIFTANEKGMQPKVLKMFEQTHWHSLTRAQSLLTGGKGSRMTEGHRKETKSLPDTETNTIFITHPHTQSHTHTHPHTQSHTHCHTHSHTHTPTHTVTHTVTQRGKQNENTLPSADQ